MSPVPTINARHGSKYFGLKKGVSAYTLVANHVPCNARIIGTHEHESHFVFDILHNNTAEIQPERHSTDTHGSNQVNFLLLFCDGYQFAPRYRDLHKKTASLVGVRHPSHYAGSLIKPTRKIRDDLIVREWPNIQRIVASLMQKDVTQAILARMTMVALIDTALDIYFSSQLSNKWMKLANSGAPYRGLSPVAYVGEHGWPGLFWILRQVQAWAVGN